MSTAKLDFDDFFYEQRNSLAAQAYVLTRDVEDARDLVQEVFVRCWRNWDRVSEMDRPDAWARVVLHNLAVSQWRRRVRRPTIRLDESRLVAASPPTGHLDLVRELGRLPEAHRRALLLHDVVGLSVAETALEMRAPEGSIRGWLSRGRRQLSLALERSIKTEVTQDD